MYKEILLKKWTMTLNFIPALSMDKLQLIQQKDYIWDILHIIVIL